MRLKTFSAAWLIGLAAFGSGSGHAATQPASAATFEAVVTRVVDGDTVWLQAAGNRRADWVKTRIQGIDAPEICQPGGPSSRDALVGRVMGKRVWVAAQGRDDYGRLLARLAAGPGGRDDVGAWMVGNGQAWSYRFRWNPGPYAREQRLARTARRGLFARLDAEEPAAFRKRHGPCPWPPGWRQPEPAALSAVLQQ